MVNHRVFIRSYFSLFDNTVQCLVMKAFRSNHIRVNSFILSYLPLQVYFTLPEGLMITVFPNTHSSFPNHSWAIVPPLKNSGTKRIAKRLEFLVRFTFYSLFCICFVKKARFIF